MTTSPAKLRAHALPLHEQIYIRIRTLIEQGHLKNGQRLPSLRSYSTELGVARGTVEVAYDRLLGDGFLVTRGSAGTFVAEQPNPVVTLSQRRSTETMPRPVWREHGNAFVELHGALPSPLQLGLPALDKFPRKLWTRLMTSQARSIDALTKPPSAGYWPLREALAAYLLRSRGIDARAEQVFVLPAYTASLAMIADALRLAGEIAWVEHPGYPPAAHALGTLGMPLRHVPVDDNGIDVRYGIQHYPDARLVVVTPSHQCPTGAELSLDRRTALLAWAASRDAWIVEDDYDGEYRYRGHPLPALRSLDASDRVFYCGTLSKVLYPGLRLSYTVVPLSQVQTIESACQRALHGGCPEFLQAVAATFISEGHFARHIKRMRTLYAQRRAMLATALIPYEGHGFEVRLQEGGMHLLVDVADGLDDVFMARRARKAGFGIQSLTDWRQGEPGRRALMMGFTNLTSQSEADRVVADLMEVLLSPLNP
ncbi:MocR-like pyridoxine biosynthesis transcription factor PdxR [Cupriavidus pauculus]|uniref:PLP-dependent aminotransferase family protein n=1 Tax=Cupriavidus pauculus TaxID=82633 RepID=A0A2N5CB60_9BURK|nr:PLP-dependent aminotransferase family protein [Cupriavidus pauculus]PLP99470.1 PLP-dependent aminotransferase family protein [Cupriavidus pauculus]